MLVVHEFVVKIVIVENWFFWVVVIFTQALFEFSVVGEVSRGCRYRVV